MRRTVRRRELRGGEQVSTTPTEKERDAIDRLYRAHRDLLDMGWESAMGAKWDSSVRIELIETGSTGIHPGFRDKDGSFWAHDGETYPSLPCLFRKTGKPPAPVKLHDAKDGSV